MILLEIHITLEDGSRIPCGELRCCEPGDLIRGGAFRYNPQYLDHPKAFPLDPVNLPLRPGIFEVKTPSGFPSAISDSLPDAWGMTLLKERAYREGLRPDDVPAHLLIALGSGSMGALDFQPMLGKKCQGPPAGGLMVGQLTEMVDYAALYDEGLALQDDQMAVLLDGGSSPGGARPKALIQDGDDLYLAKFPRKGDRLDMVRLEAACLTLMEWAGGTVPKHKVVQAGQRPVLMVERFDRTPEGKAHRISFDTLLRDREDLPPRGTYPAMFEALRKWSDRPNLDVELLYRQMCLNVLLGNTDDHLRNFSLVRRGGEWRLSPAYDIAPYTQERRAHSVMLPGDPPSTQPPEDLEGLRLMGRALRVPQAAKILQQVVDAVQRWPEACAIHGVSDKDRDAVAEYIEKRIQVEEDGLRARI